MPDFSWPPAEQRSLIGKRITRVDSPVKVTGRAKYSYDYVQPGMLFGKMLRSPYAKAKIVGIDTSAALKIPGVKAIEVIQKAGDIVQWEGDEIAGVAAVDEPTAEDAIRAIKVQYQPLPHLVSDAEPPANAASLAGPLSDDDIYDALSNQMPEQDLIRLLQTNGVSFHADEDFQGSEELRRFPTPSFRPSPRRPFMR